MCVCLCVRRALCRVKMWGQDDPIHLNNPTAAAVASLSSNFPYSEPFLNSFFHTGGVLALQKVLRESSCPLAIGNAVCFIAQILLGEDPRKMKWRQQIALLPMFHPCCDQHRHRSTPGLHSHQSPCAPRLSCGITCRLWDGTRLSGGVPQHALALRQEPHG